MTNKSKRKTNSTSTNPEQSKLDHEYRIKKVESIAATIHVLAKYGALAIIAVAIYLMIDSLAGKQTDAKFIGLPLTLDSKTLGTIFGAGGILYGYGERKLRQKTVKRLQPRIQELEQRLDPNRSSSLLTPTGETNPVDE